VGGCPCCRAGDRFPACARARQPREGLEAIGIAVVGLARLRCAGGGASRPARLAPATSPARTARQTAYSRTRAASVISLTNALLVVTLIASLVQGDEKSGNVIAFGLWYWGLDRGGPVR
jgi:hypothetical protein